MKDPKKEIHRLNKELNSYKDTLRNASLLFEDKVLELSLLKRVGDIVGYILDPELFYRMFVDILFGETNAENCSIMIMDTETNRLSLKMARGRNDEGTFFTHPVDSEVTFFLGEEVAKKVALERKTILIDDVSIDKCFEIKETRLPIASMLCAPLIFQEKVFGVINLSHAQPHAFSQSNQRIMDLLCAFVSSIIGNAIDYSKIKDQEKFKSMFEGVRIPILLVDPKTNRIIGCNGYAEEWLGYSKKELIQTDHIFNVVSHEYREKVECIVNEIVETNSSKFNEVLFIRKDGSVKVGEINGTTIDYQGMNIVQMTIRDVTERKQDESQLREAKEYLTNAIENSLDAIIFSDNKGCISIANQSFLRMIGGREQETIGKHMAEFSPMEEGTYESTTGELVQLGKEYLDDILTFVSVLVEGGKITNYESYLIRNDGKIVPVEENIALLYNEKRERIGAIGVIRDITERKIIEKEIKTSRDFLKSVIESSRDGIVIVDEKGHIISINNALTEMSKFSKEELIGQHVSFLTIEDRALRKMTLEKTGELFEKGFTFYQSKHRVKEGACIEVECNCSMIKNDEGNFTAGVSIIRNISERKIIEKALRKSEEQYQNLIEHANDAVVSMNNEGMIVTFNKKAQELYGYTHKEILGKSVLSLVPPSHREQQKKIIEKLKAIDASTMQGRTVETKGFRKDGREFPVEVSLFGLETKEGDIFTSFIRDISERKNMEQQLLQSEKLKSLGELAGGVAHNFNNALAVILGRAQLLKINIGPPPDKGERRQSIIELKKGLETIERASLDGAETVRRIQEFSRRRNDDKYFTSVDINKIIDDALEFTKLEWKDGAESKGIKINIQKELSTLPATSGSAAELREVFTNIINNAIFAMPQGGTITVKTFREGSYACVKVQDTGMGIPETIRNRIFDPFFTTKGPQSSGLGMSVSYGIIERHRGTISADSVEGEGTTFTIEIPFSEKTAEKGKVVPISSGQKKVDILIVEDEEDVRNLLKDILTHEGHRVETASNGKIGIEKFKKKKFDMVLTDLGMPGISGWQVAEKIKAINGKIPIALITGWSIDMKEYEMKEKGVDFIIKKPYDLDQLVNVIQEGMLLRDQLKAV